MNGNGRECNTSGDETGQENLATLTAAGKVLRVPTSTDGADWLANLGSDDLVWLQALGRLATPANDAAPDDPPPAAPAQARHVETLPPPCCAAVDIVAHAAGSVVHGAKRSTCQDGLLFEPGSWGPKGPMATTVIAPSEGFGFSVAVADGANGEPEGAVAMKRTLGALRAASPDGRWPRDPWERIHGLGRAFREANAMVRNAVEEDGTRRGMGASVTYVSIVERVLVLAHVGHTGAMLVRRGRAHRLTPSHTVAAELVRQGALSPADALTSPFRSTLMRAIGLEKGLAPSFAVRKLQPGDILVVGSNGLWNAVQAEVIAAVVQEEREPTYACERLTAMASAETWDDVTVVVVHVDGPGLR